MPTPIAMSWSTSPKRHSPRLSNAVAPELPYRFTRLRGRCAMRRSCPFISAAIPSTSGIPPMRRKITPQSTQPHTGPLLPSGGLTPKSMKFQPSEMKSAGHANSVRFGPTAVTAYNARNASPRKIDPTMRPGTPDGHGRETWYGTLPLAHVPPISITARIENQSTVSEADTPAMPMTMRIDRRTSRPVSDPGAASPGPGAEVVDIVRNASDGHRGVTVACSQRRAGAQSSSWGQVPGLPATGKVAVTSRPSGFGPFDASRRIPVACKPRAIRGIPPTHAASARRRERTDPRGQRRDARAQRPAWPAPAARANRPARPAARHRASGRCRRSRRS